MTLSDAQRSDTLRLIYVRNLKEHHFRFDLLCEPEQMRIEDVTVRCRMVQAAALWNQS